MPDVLFMASSKKHAKLQKKFVHKKPSKPVRRPIQQPKQPLVRAPKAKPPSQEIIDRLMKKGQSRGFITENEVLFTFSDVEDYLPIFEDFFDLMEKGGIHM